MAPGVGGCPVLWRAGPADAGVTAVHPVDRGSPGQTSLQVARRPVECVVQQRANRFQRGVLPLDLGAVDWLEVGHGVGREALGAALNRDESLPARAVLLRAEAGVVQLRVLVGLPTAGDGRCNGGGHLTD